MPAHFRQAKLSTSRLQDAAKKILRAECCAVAAGTTKPNSTAQKIAFAASGENEETENAGRKLAAK